VRLSLRQCRRAVSSSSSSSSASSTSSGLCRYGRGIGCVTALPQALRTCRCEGVCCAVNPAADAPHMPWLPRRTRPSHAPAAKLCRQLDEGHEEEEACVRAPCAAPDAPPGVDIRCGPCPSSGDRPWGWVTPQLRGLLGAAPSALRQEEAPAPPRPFNPWVHAAVPEHLGGGVAAALWREAGAAAGGAPSEQ
jgi:hypothetical protein